MKFLLNWDRIGDKIRDGRYEQNKKFMPSASCGLLGKKFGKSAPDGTIAGAL